MFSFNADIEEKEIDPIFVDIEIDRSKLKIEEELGSGQFGVVYKAFAIGLHGDKDEYVQVAVKGLKGKLEGLFHKTWSYQW